MRKLVVLSMLGALVGLVVPPATAASTQVGNSCTAFDLAPGYTLVMTAKSAANPLPVAAPSSGVITKATFNVPNGAPSTYPQVIKAVRSTGVAGTYQVIAQSAAVPVGAGISTHDVRVPLAAGDLLGLHGTAGALYCETGNVGDTMGVSMGDVQPGQSAAFTLEPEYALPLVATIEPDADKDGYGDDTQDKCPQNASTQAACPRIKLDSSATAQRNAIRLVVTTDIQAKVKVTGTVKVNGKKIKLKGGTKTINAGKLGKFTVRYPKALRAALSAMPPGKSLRVKLTATAANIVGKPSKTKSTVRVHGTKH